MNQITLYCNCYGTKLNKQTQFNQKNLLCGSSFETEAYKNSLTNFLFDDTGNNISNLNKVYGELTGLYWIWKNNTDQIVGTNQYRIFWDEQSLKKVKFDSNTIAVVKALNVNTAVRSNSITKLSVYDHYSFCHGDMGLILLHGLCEFKKLKIKNHMIEELKHTNMLIPYNMFVANKELFDKTCEILFEILFEYYDSFHYLLDSIEKKYQQIRMIDYLTERLLNVIYKNAEYFYGKHITFIETPVIEFSH